MQFSAAQIAMMANGRVEGDASVMVESFGKIEEATPSQLTFLANPKYEEYLYLTKASVIIVNEAQDLRQEINATLIRVPDAYSAFATLLDKYQQIQTQQLTGIEQPSFIHPTAKIGEGVYIGAFCLYRRKRDSRQWCKNFSNYLYWPKHKCR
jgi:UDP-3-O-[3-hydroxymyristoyl] glucosamine N-acyltransferase